MKKLERLNNLSFLFHGSTEISTEIKGKAGERKRGRNREKKTKAGKEKT